MRTGISRHVFSGREENLFLRICKFVVSLMKFSEMLYRTLSDHEYSDAAGRIVYEDNHLLIVNKMAGEIVQADEQYKGLVGYLLGRVVVVSDIDSAISLARKFQYSLRIVTLDGYRLALSADPALTVKAPFFIPVEAMSELQMFKGQSCTLCVGEKYALFENETLRLLTRIPENDHLDIDRMIPSRFEEEFIVPVEPLWEEVKYLSEAANKKERQPIRFNGQTMELETADGLYAANVGLPPITVRGFNPRYLLEGFGQFKAKKAPTVIMKVGHPHSPIILTDDESDLAMVLPVRLKAA